MHRDVVRPAGDRGRLRPQALGPRRAGAGGARGIAGAYFRDPRSRCGIDDNTNVDLSYLDDMARLERLLSG